MESYYLVQFLPKILSVIILLWMPFIKQGISKKHLVFRRHKKHLTLG